MSRATDLFGSKVIIPDTTNMESYPAFSKRFDEAYLQLLLTNTVGNTFYASSDELLADTLKYHSIAYAELGKIIGAPWNTFKIEEYWVHMLTYARRVGYMRLQPIIGLVYFLQAGLFLGNEDFCRILNTPNDLIDFVTILKSIRGNEGGRHIRKLVNYWLENKLNPYWIVKYGAEKPGAYSLSDIIRIYHPHFGKTRLDVAYLLKKTSGVNPELRAEFKEIFYYESLKSAKTLEDKVNAITNGNLPHEVSTVYAGSSSEIWSAIIKNMPPFALLRNLATIERHGLIGDFRSYINSVFTDKEKISKAMILPYRFLDAMDHVRDSGVRDSLRIAVENSFTSLPEIYGRTAIALDISGSMDGKFLKVASIFAIALYKKSEDTLFYTFNHDAQQIAISRVDSILTQAEKIRASGGTDTSAVLDNLYHNKVFVDNFIMITDEQQNTGTPLYKLINAYKKSINPNLKVFIVNVAPYVRSQSTLDNTDNVYYIYGWSDKVLQYISYMTKGAKSLTSLLMPKG